MIGIAKALLYLHGGKVVAWMVFGFGLSETNLIHFFYLFLVLVGSALRSGRRGMPFAVGLILLILAQIVVLAQMAYGFQAVQDKFSRNALLAHWIGFEDGTLWDTLHTHLAIIILVTLHRMSYWWIHTHPQHSPRPLPQVHDLMLGSTSINAEQDKAGADEVPRVSSVENLSLSILPSTYSSTNSVDKGELAPAPLSVGSRAAAYITNFYSIFGYEVTMIFLYCFISNYFIDLLCHFVRGGKLPPQSNGNYLPYCDRYWI